MNIVFLMFKVIFYVASPFIACFAFWLVYYLIKGKRFKKSKYPGKRKVGQGKGLLSAIKRLFYLFPKRYILDCFERDPDCFPEYGVHIVAGEQGTGKTITLVYLLLTYKQMYPGIVVKTNMGYANEDAPIEHWRDLVASTNGIYGEVDVIDEVQNWFNSLQSKDFPIEMMTEITQQRKQTKIIIGTTQVFTRAAKPIREQTYLLYEPYTFFGCLTVVFKRKPVLDDSGTVTKNKFRGFFFFVHDDEIRNAFDTYKKIQKYSDEGFKSEELHMTNGGATVINDFSNVRKLKTRH